MNNDVKQGLKFIAESPRVRAAAEVDPEIAEHLPPLERAVINTCKRIVREAGG